MVDERHRGGVEPGFARTVRIGAIRQRAREDLVERIGRAGEASDLDLLAELTAQLQTLETDLADSLQLWEQISGQLEEADEQTASA